MNLHVKELLDAGVHFGHQTNRGNPKMKKFIYGERNGVYIIDLQQTMVRLRNAYNFIRDLVANGESVLFVGTKRQAVPLIEEEATRCQMFYVNQRWLGGMLTNLKTIRQSIDKMKKMDIAHGDGTYEQLPKKEVLRLEKERGKLSRNLSGVRNMDVLPGCLVVADTRVEQIAIKEANRLEIPLVAILDTNSDPDGVSYPIPGNDDAAKGIRLILSTLADAAIEGQQINAKRREDLQTEAAASMPEEIPSSPSPIGLEPGETIIAPPG
ncbi:MAG TPA: 30S ribosomal protein S2 [Nitrospirales bacterium]|nr:30S ribosomal protein S2 [Nitrospirales bacterium]